MTMSMIIIRIVLTINAIASTTTPNIMLIMIATTKRNNLYNDTKLRYMNQMLLYFISSTKILKAATTRTAPAAAN
jgi:hypothetical protein